jgi:branched-chain amino acid transport system permease protein
MNTLFATKYRDYLLCAAAVLILLTGLISDNKYTLDILITMVYFCTLASAWNIMCGFTGQLSLGHGAFLGLGQYTSTLLFTRLDISPWIGMIAGGLTAMLLALLVGLLALRLKGPFFALATIALTAILEIFAVKFDNITGGSVGITIPYRPSLENMIFQNYHPTYFLFVCLLAVVLIVTIVINKSRLGSNLVAIRENELTAASLGINVFRNQVYALMISSFFTGVVGTLYAQHVLFIDPAGSFSVVVSEKAALISIIGGAGTVFGPLIGGILLAPAEIFLRTWLGSTYQGAYLIVYGVLLIFVILVIPKGIAGTLGEYIKKTASKI